MRKASLCKGTFILGAILLAIGAEAGDGDFAWAKRMGGTSADEATSIAVDSIGNVYTMGYFYDTADFDPGAGVFNLTSAGDADIFVSKIDSSETLCGLSALEDRLGYRREYCGGQHR